MICKQLFVLKLITIIIIRKNSKLKGIILNTNDIMQLNALKYSPPTLMTLFNNIDLFALSYMVLSIPI